MKKVRSPARREIRGDGGNESSAAKAVVGAVVLEGHGQAIGSGLGELWGEGETIVGEEDNQGKGKGGAAAGNSGNGALLFDEEGACVVVGDR